VGKSEGLGKATGVCSKRLKVKYERKGCRWVGKRKLEGLAERKQLRGGNWRNDSRGGKGRGLVTVCDKLVLLHEDFRILLPSRSPTLLFCTVKSCANCLLRTSILLFSLSMIFYLGIKNSCKVLCNLPQFSITHSNSLPLFGKFPGLLTPIPSLV